MAEKSHTTSTPCLAAALSPTASSSTDGSNNGNNNNVARIQRNVAEKQRRDKLNGYISELATIVPMISMSSKRLDKTSILRLSAAHLRICKSPLGGNKKLKKSLKWCPSFLSDDQIRGILESVDGFLIVTTPTGKILFTSRSVERYLGHQDIDLIGHSLYTFTHPDDLDSVKEEMERLLLTCVENGSSRCSFQCRLKEKAQPRSEAVTYQYVHFVGGMAIVDEDDKASRSVVSHMFKAFVKVVDISPYNQLSLEEATADEYVTRHSLDGTIIFADHRLATITGHMPHEVVGLSAYEYIHKDDTSIALFAHHLMFSNDKGTGMIVYRLRTRDDRYVYLKSVGCLQYDSATSQVDHFVCVNQQLDESDGDLQLKYFIDRYIPHIKGSSASSLFESVKALQISSSKPSPSNHRMNGISHSEDDSSNPGNVEPTVSNKKTEARKVKEKGRRNSKSELGANSNQKACRKKRHSLPQPASPDFVNKNGTINPCSPDIPQNEVKVKRQNIGTIATNVNVNSDMEYFNGTVNSSSSEPDKDIYTSSMNANQSDNVNTQSKSMLSSLLSENSYCVTKGPNHHVHNNSTEMVVGSIKTCSDENSYESLSIAESEGSTTVQIGTQFPHLGVREKKRNGDRHSILEHNKFFQDDYENTTLSGKEEIDGNISLCHSPVKDVFNSKHDGMCITDSSSLLEMQLVNGYKDEDVIRGNVDESFLKHSSFGSHSNCIDDIHPTLSVVNSNDSDAVLRNSRWSVDNCFKFQSDIEDTTTSSMDYCDTMPSAEDEVNGDLKDSLTFQDDLSSLLSSTLPHSDSNSLPSANGWNDIFSSTEYSSPLSNEDLLQKDDEQLLITNPKVKSYDLW